MDDPLETVVDVEPPPADVSVTVRLGRLNRYFFGRLARLLQRLDERGLLASTLVLAGSDMGNPAAHSTRNIPLVLAGGANGRLTLGRRLVAPEDAAGLAPHNRVLVSIARLFGDERDAFGVGPPELISGGWPGL